MLLELVPGGEMWTLLHGDLKLLPSGPSKGLRNDDAVFYSAMVASAVKYMHERKIAYRDMKPENLVIDARVSPSSEGLFSFVFLVFICGP